MSTPLLSSAPPSRGRKRKLEEDVTDPFIFCKKECNEDKSDYPTDSWNKLKAVELEWKGLDKYGNVFESVNWDNGPSGSFFISYARLSSQVKGNLNSPRQGKQKLKHLL